jgi:hypothetical protein
MNIDFRKIVRQMWDGITSSMLQINFGVALKRMVEGLVKGVTAAISYAAKSIFGG